MIKDWKKSGQSTIEFLFSFIFVFGFVFLFLKVSYNYTNGFLVHYANFMAARAYMVVDTNSNSPDGSDAAAAKRATEIFDNQFALDKFIPGFGRGKLKINSPTYSGHKLYIGAYVEYSEKFSSSPVLGGTSRLKLMSESFLGREPTRSECLARICQSVVALGSDCTAHVTIADNGC